MNNTILFFAVSKRDITSYAGEDYINAYFCAYAS